jgi:hypothetical protein
MKQTLQTQATHSELELEAANGYGQRENSTKREEPYVSIPSCYSGRGNTRRHAIVVRLLGDEVRIIGVGVTVAEGVLRLS